MKIWNMTKKDLQVFFKDRAAWLWLFIIPLVFILIFAGLSGQTGGGSSDAEEDQRTPLEVVSLDFEGETLDQFLAALEHAGGYQVVLIDQQTAEARMDKFKLMRYLLIPQNFSADLAQGKPVAIELVVHPNADVQTTQSLLRIIVGVANDASLELQILDGIRQMGEMQAADPNVQQTFTTERVLQQAKSQFDRSRQTPLIGIAQRAASQPEEAGSSGFDFGTSIVPGLTVLFVFLSAQFVARNIYEERKVGSLRRLLSAPLRRPELLLGKMLPIFLLTLIQIGVIFTAGAFLLPALGLGRLGVGNDPLAWAVASIVIALCATSLGICIASLARTEGQITGLSTAVLWIAGFLGGALVPSFFLQSVPVLAYLQRLVPQFYANTAYYDILARGQSLVDVLPYLGILLIFTAVFFIVGVRRFRFM